MSSAMKIRHNFSLNSLKKKRCTFSPLSFKFLDISEFKNLRVEQENVILNIKLGIDEKQ